MKKAFIITSIVATMIFGAPGVLAEDVTCVTQYSGGQVCGRKTPETPHAPVKAGLGDINLSHVGAAFVTMSGVLYVKGRRQVAH